METEAPDSMLRPGDTCWRVAAADRAAVLLDNAAYFAALAAALRQARRSVLLLGWTFDPRTVLEPETPGAETIGELLKRLAQERPDLEIRVLIWRMDLPIAATQGMYPLKAAPFFKHSRVQFRLDRTVPLGACHHQKMVVIDDAVAFCGGGDISVDRWDTPEHPPEHPGRRMPNGKIHPPRHEVMLLVSGPIARRLGDHVRRRWETATDEPLSPPPNSEDDAWPEAVAPSLFDVRVGVARTEPAWRGEPGCQEIERLYLAAIQSAQSLLVLENQYVASPVIEAALGLRLQAADGPEIVVITTRKSPSWFDQMTMDRTRAAMIGRLRAADVYGRFRAWCPVTSAGQTIIVHSKVAIVDDRLLRVGSANLNNRSFGFDTEFDMAIEAETPDARATIAGFRTRLLAHWLGVTEDELIAAGNVGEPGMVGMLDRLAERTGRLVPVEHFKPGPIRNMIALHHLGDPVEPTDSWLPWLRTGKLMRRTRRLLGRVRNRR